MSEKTIYVYVGAEGLCPEIGTYLIPGMEVLLTEDEAKPFGARMREKGKPIILEDSLEMEG